MASKDARTPFWPWVVHRMDQEIDAALNRSVDRMVALLSGSSKKNILPLLLLDSGGSESAAAMARVASGLGCALIGGKEIKQMDMFMVEEEPWDMLVFIEDADHWRSGELDRIISQLCAVRARCRMFLVLESNLGYPLIENTVSSEFVFPQLEVTRMSLLQGLDLGSILFPKKYGTSDIQLYGFPPISFPDTCAAEIAPMGSISLLEFKRFTTAMVEKYFARDKFACIWSKWGKNPFDKKHTTSMIKTIAANLDQDASAAIQEAFKCPTANRLFASALIAIVAANQQLGVCSRIVCNVYRAFSTSYEYSTLPHAVEFLAKLRIFESVREAENFKLNLIPESVNFLMEDLKQRLKKALSLFDLPTIVCKIQYLNNTELKPHLEKSIGLSSKSEAIDSVVYFNNLIAPLAHQNFNQTKNSEKLLAEIRNYLMRVLLEQVYGPDVSVEDLVMRGKVIQMFSDKWNDFEDLQDHLSLPDLFLPTLNFLRNASGQELRTKCSEMKGFHQLVHLMYGKSRGDQESGSEDEEEPVVGGKISINTKSSFPLEELKAKYKSNFEQLSQELATMELLGLVRQSGMADLVGDGNGLNSTIRIRKCYTDTNLTIDPDCVTSGKRQPGKKLETDRKKLNI